MNTYYNNRTHSLCVSFSLEDNGNDRVKIGSSPRTDSGTYDTKNGVSVMLYKNSFKINKDGSPNYRNVEVFYKAIENIVSQYKSNPDTATRQFSSSYVNTVTGHTIQFAFGVLEKDGLPIYVLYFTDSFESNIRKSMYKFKDIEEVEKFVNQLKLFCDDKVHMTTHLIYSELNNLIAKAVGEQLTQIVRAEFVNQYPELSKVIIKAISDRMN